MARMKFFHGIKVQTFIGRPAANRDKENKRSVIIPIRIQLNGNTIRSAPQPVARAYEEVKDNGGQMVGPLKYEVEGVNADIFDLEEHEKTSAKLKSLYLEKLVVREVKSSTGDSAIVLCCQFQRDFADGLWAWLGSHYKTDVWIRFDAAQATLLDIEEHGAEEPEEADDQGALEIDTEAPAAPN